MNNFGDSVHFSIIVRDSSDGATALLDFAGADIAQVTDEAVSLDPSFLVFDDSINSPESNARRSGVDANTIRSALPFYATKVQLETFGVQLYNQLFGNEKMLAGFSAAQQHGRDVDLPIRLCFENRDVARYSDIPWEALCQPGPPREHLGDSRKLNIVRTVRGLAGLQSRPEPEQVRVLIVAASPDPGNQVMVNEELLGVASRLEDSWARFDGSERQFKFDWQDPVINATKEDVINALERSRPHIVHFIGHGSYSDGVGYLHLHGQENPDATVKVSASDLVVMMRDRRPELFLLNSCEGAVGGSGNFSGVAESLLKTNCARFVVAMQYPISNAAAIAFVEGFYPALQQGESVDAAVSLGRNRIHAHEKDAVAVEFITPALYMNGNDGRLFKQVVSPPEVPNERPAWLVPTLIAVVALALIAAATFVFKINRETEMLEKLSSVQTVIQDARLTQATAAVQQVVAECEPGGCDPEVLVRAQSASELVALMQKARSEFDAGSWEEARQTLHSIERLSSESWLKDDVEYIEETSSIVEQQVKAEQELLKGDWQSAFNRFDSLRRLLSDDASVSIGTRNLVSAPATRDSSSGLGYAKARVNAFQAAENQQWRIAESALEAAASARPGVVEADIQAVLALGLFSQAVKADNLFVSGYYDQAKEAYRFILGTATVFAAPSDWMSLQAHALLRLEQIFELQKSDPEPAGNTGPDEGLSGSTDSSQSQALVSFGTDSVLISADARQRIATVAAQLSALGTPARIRVTGRADARGSDSYNRNLATRRAEAVEAALVLTGVDAKLIEVRSVGERWASSPLANAETLAEERSTVLELFHPEVAVVNFAFGSAQVPPGIRPKLAELAVWVGERQNLILKLTGHTDAAGSSSANERVGMRRAMAVAAELEAPGVPVSSLAVASAGERQLLVPRTAKFQRANRRVVITLVTVD